MKTKINFLLFALLSSNIFAGSFTSSGAGPAAWNVATSWTYSGDTDGIPDADDDVTIEVGHTITLPSGTFYCRDLTVNGIFNLDVSTSSLQIRGNYVVNGVESGKGRIEMRYSTGKTISGAGTFSYNTKYAFLANVTISSNVVFSKNTINITANKILTNQGNITILKTIAATGSVFTNDVNSTLTITSSGFMTGGTFNAHASGNTVKIKYNSAVLPNTAAGFNNLTIDGTSVSQPSATTVLGNFTINSGKSFNCNNQDLNIAGNFSNNGGTFLASADKTVNFNGTSSAQTISSSATETFQNITINNGNGVSLSSGSYNLIQTLTVNNGNFNANGRPFVMISTASNTARIATLEPGSSISGNFTIQKYISARNSNYCDLASPVQEATLADWDTRADGITNELYISGCGGDDVDGLPGYTHTIYSYNESTPGYFSVQSIDTLLVPGRSFEMWLGTTITNLDAVTIDTYGVPNQGDITIPVTRNGIFEESGWNLVGNPFASAIAWDGVQRTDIDDNFWVYESSTGTFSSHGPGEEISAHQGFWVHSSTGSPSLTIPESAKITNSATWFLKQANEYFTLKISNDVNPFSAEAKIKINEYANGKYDAQDALFKLSREKLAPNIKTLTDDFKKVQINTISNTLSDLAIPISVYAGFDGKYTIEISGMEYLHPYSCAYIEDKKLNSIIDISNKKSFEVDLKEGEDNDRFVIHLSQSAINCRKHSNEKENLETSEEFKIINSTDGLFAKFNLKQEQNTEINIYNLLGQNVYSTRQKGVKNETIKLNYNSEITSIYLIEIKAGEKILKEKILLKF